MNKFQALEVLDLPPESSEADIKKRYRTLCNELHPDRNPEQTEEEEARFKSITEAYECLAGKKPSEDDSVEDAFIAIFSQYKSESNPINACKEYIQTTIQIGYRKVASNKAHIEQFKTTIEKLMEANEEGPKRALMIEILEGAINEQQQSIASNERRIASVEQVQKYMMDLHYPETVNSPYHTYGYRPSHAFLEGWKTSDNTSS